MDHASRLGERREGELFKPHLMHLGASITYVCTYGEGVLKFVQTNSTENAAEGDGGF